MARARRLRRTLSLATLVAALAVAGCLVLAGSGDGWRAPVAAASDRGDVAAAGSGPRRAKLRLIKSRFGRVLADRDGFALYVFTRDKRRRKRASRSYEDCATAWPPLLTSRRPSAGRGIRRKLVGLTRRRDGTKQATYAGRPLYHYVGDTRPRQILCQDVFEFGGRWFVTKRSGKPVR